jgi:hypothetical protein
MNVGDKVACIKHDGSYENGIVKSFGGNNTTFVVYHCAGEWDNYQNYTAANTANSQLFIGWR